MAAGIRTCNLLIASLVPCPLGHQATVHFLQHHRSYENFLGLLERDFYEPDAIQDTQPTTLKHRTHIEFRYCS